ncbi:MAG: tetratricopeptide repeat protein [Acidobacteria bacterium]|nr:MAG: tetratricopeptide repeat protein [Acidobacteriota bacterium]
MKLSSPIACVALVVLAVTSFPSASARSQDLRGHREARGTLMGSVQLPSDMTKYPSFIQVTLDGADYRETTTATSGGTFMFASVPPGDFVIEVRARGYDTSRTELRGFSGTSEVSVPLGTAAGDNADRVPPGSPTISVRTLKVPEKAVKLAGRAQEESDKQHFDKAVEWLQKAVQLCPEFVEAWNNMGVNYLRMSRQEEAETAFLKALEADSKNVPALRNLGFLYLQAERYREALPVLVKAREARGEEDLYLATYLGHALYGTGQYQEAEAVLKRAIRINSDFPAALYPLALAQVQLHEYQDARQTFSRFLQMSEKGNEADVARSLVARLDQMLGEEEQKSAE